VLELRELTNDDWPVWRDARIAALTEAPQVFKSRLADWDTTGERYWRTRMERPDTYNAVALLDGVVVGMVSGVPDDSGVPHLHSLWVSPEARGRGVGDLLIGGVRTWAAGTGAAVLKLAVVPGNDAAVGLYRRHGFAMTDELGELLDDGATRENVMETALSG
jgi:ribosomal protein S18 acetylase RimI-like enzyme